MIDQRSVEIGCFLYTSLAKTNTNSVFQNAFMPTAWPVRQGGAQFAEFARNNIAQNGKSAGSDM